MINEQSQAASRALSDAEQLHALVIKAYADARTEVDAELKRLLAMTELPKEKLFDHYRKRNRFKVLLKQIDKAYLGYVLGADRLTRQSVKIAANESYARYQYVLKYFSPIKLGINAKFSGLPLPLAEVIINGNLKQFDSIRKQVRDKIESQYGLIKGYFPQNGTLSQLLINNRQAAVNGINRAITSGIIQGKSARDIGKSIRKVIGDRDSGATYKALRIARTETIRSLNDGAFAAMQKITDLGVKQQKMWVATVDLRTRDSHQALDGQRADMDKDFNGLNGSGSRPGSMGSASENINCRCRIVSVFDDVKPNTKEGINPVNGQLELFNWRDYEAWKAS